MGRAERQNSSSTSSEMDIDPRPTSWNSLGPTFLEARRTKIKMHDDSSCVVGSPPPAASPKVHWNEHFPNSKVEDFEPKTSAMDTSELASRVQEIRIQPQQPMIICETVEDVKVGSSEMDSASSESLTVPPIDVTNEKKRPPIPSP